MVANREDLFAKFRQYRQILEHHHSLLTAEFAQLEGRWLALRAVYEGDAAQQFEQFFQKEMAYLVDYFDKMQQLVLVLTAQIEHNQHNDTDSHEVE